MDKLKTEKNSRIPVKTEPITNSHFNQSKVIKDIEGINQLLLSANIIG